MSKLSFDSYQIDFDLNKFFNSFNVLDDSDLKTVVDKNNKVIYVIGGYTSNYTGNEIDNFIEEVLYG